MRIYLNNFFLLIMSFRHERRSKMAKLTAIVVTIIGVLMLLQAGGWITALDPYYMWLYAIGVLVIGIGKLMRNFKK